MKLKLKLKQDKHTVWGMAKDSLFITDWRRYMCPPPEDLPLLKKHYDGEWFERIDGFSVVHRWKNATGEGHTLMFYPAPEAIKELEYNEHNHHRRDNYRLLLLKILQKNGYADYNSIPSEVTYEEFDKYLNIKPKEKLRLKLRKEVA